MADRGRPTDYKPALEVGDTIARKGEAVTNADGKVVVRFRKDVPYRGEGGVIVYQEEVEFPDGSNVPVGSALDHEIFRFFVDRAQGGRGKD